MKSSAGKARFKARISAHRFTDGLAVIKDQPLTVVMDSKILADQPLIPPAQYVLQPRGRIINWAVLQRPVRVFNATHRLQRIGAEDLYVQLGQRPAEAYDAGDVLRWPGY